jgi:hypothetical protein
MKVARQLFTFLILSVFSTGCEDCCIRCCGKPDIDFIGKWSIVTSTRNNIERPEWKDLQLEFVHSGITNGIYLCPASPDTTVWHAQGYWDLNGADSSFYRFAGDSLILVTCQLSAKKDQLQLKMEIPTKEQYNCGEDSICNAIVLKEWLFDLKREN